MSEEERRAYEEFLAARAAQEDILQTAHDTGKAEIAHSMLQEGMTPAIIAKITGLSLDEISALSTPEEA